MEPLLKKAWQRAWNLGHESAKRYDVEREALEALSMDELEVIAMIDGCSEFFSAGFRGRTPEWVEAIRYGDVPECDFSINHLENKREPGVSCIKIIRNAEDESVSSIFSR